MKISTVLQYIKSKIPPIPRKVKRWVFRLFHPMSLCRFKYGSNTVTLLRSGWVIISDGHSSDALPFYFLSQKLIDVIEEHLE